MTTNKYQLVPKTEGGITGIYYITPSGRTEPILFVRFPADRQLRDDMEALDDIMAILRKRINKSIGR